MSHSVGKIDCITGDTFLILSGKETLKMIMLTFKDGITLICNSMCSFSSQLLSISYICHRNVSATVKILPEVVLPDSLHEVRDRSLDRYRSEPFDLSRPFSPADSFRLQRQRAISRRDAMMTVWPHWVHNQYNATTLSHRVKLQLSYLKLGM